jgi:hypothetical protein
MRVTGADQHSGGTGSVSEFEAGMLICFGAAWPASLWKSWRARSTGGKSVVFLYVVGLGYVCGILHKVTFNLDPVVALYALNLAMVSADIVLWYRNRRTECTAAGAKA